MQGWKVPAALAALGLGAAADAPTRTVTVEVTGVQSNQGFVQVEFCPKAQFLKACLVAGRSAARAGATEVVVRNVPFGRYAAQAYHDLDSDGALKRGMFGIPKEPAGFSNGVVPKMGPPSFDRAAFQVTAEGPETISIQLRP